MLDVPTAAALRQQVKLEVPQMAHFRFHERFRWAVDQVLLVSLGVVPAPVPREQKTLIPGLPLALPSSPPRADLLILVESKGKASRPAQASRDAPANR